MILKSGLVSDINGGKSFYAIIGIFIIKGIFVMKMLEMGNKLGNKWCEEGSSTMGAILGAAGKVGGMALNFTPIGSVARTALGVTGRGILNSEKIQSLSKKTGVLKWAGDTVLRSGLRLQDTKIGKTSFRDKANVFNKKNKEIERILGEDGAENRKKGEHLKKVEKKWWKRKSGVDNIDNVAGGEEKRKKLRELKRRKEEKRELEKTGYSRDKLLETETADEFLRNAVSIR